MKKVIWSVAILSMAACGQPADQKTDSKADDTATQTSQVDLNSTDKSKVDNATNSQKSASNKSSKENRKVEMVTVDNHGTIDYAKIKEVVKNSDYTIVDVRTPDEFAQGNISRSINIDIISNNFKAEILKLDKNSPVVVYCQSGGRSKRAMNAMKDLGFNKVFNYSGGYSEYAEKVK